MDQIDLSPMKYIVISSNNLSGDSIFTFTNKKKALKLFRAKKEDLNLVYFCEIQKSAIDGKKFGPISNLR